MNEEGFRQFLKPRQLPAELIDQHIATLTRFEDPLSRLDPPQILENTSADPAISQGVSQGNTIDIPQIPYQIKAYLNETDTALKRYDGCHCPWARELMRSGVTPVSARSFQCSAGFHKKPGEVICGEHLQADVLNAMLQGDMYNRFAMYLPQEALISTP